MYISTYIYKYIHICMHVYVYILIYIHVYVYVYICIWLYSVTSSYAGKGVASFPTRWCSSYWKVSFRVTLV